MTLYKHRAAAQIYAFKHAEHVATREEHPATNVSAPHNLAIVMYLISRSTLHNLPNASVCPLHWPGSAFLALPRGAGVESRNTTAFWTLNLLRRIQRLAGFHALDGRVSGCLGWRAGCRIAQDERWRRPARRGGCAPGTLMKLGGRVREGQRIL